MNQPEWSKKDLQWDHETPQMKQYIVGTRKQAAQKRKEFKVLWQLFTYISPKESF